MFSNDPRKVLGPDGFIFAVLFEPSKPKGKFCDATASDGNVSSVHKSFVKRNLLAFASYAGEGAMWRRP